MAHPISYFFPNVTHIMDNIYVTDQNGVLNVMEAVGTKWNTANGIPSDLPDHLKGWAILNVAWDLDINFPTYCYKPNPSEQGGGTNRYFNDLVIEHHKVGLVDGSGNLPVSMASAVLMVCQLASTREYRCPKDLPTSGNINPYGAVDKIIVHCHSGQSRSVTVAATYLYHLNKGNWPGVSSVRDAVVKVAEMRGEVDPPQPQTNALIALAEDPQTVQLIQGGWNTDYYPPPTGADWC